MRVAGPRYFGQLGLQINEIYGMSESTGLTTLSTNEQHRWGSCGFGILGTDVKIFQVCGTRAADVRFLAALFPSSGCFDRRQVQPLGIFTILS